jgi:hypothetical protein
MAKTLQENNISIILVQIDEAHSNAWPMAINSLLGVTQPEPQKTFEDRITRAKYFVESYNPPYTVMIDSWSNDFAEMFRAWPDKYHIIDQNLKVVAKSEYHKDGDNDALIIEDCTIALEKLMQ